MKPSNVTRFQHANRRNLQILQLTLRDESLAQRGFRRLIRVRPKIVRYFKRKFWKWQRQQARRAAREAVDEAASLLAGPLFRRLSPG